MKTLLVAFYLLLWGGLALAQSPANDDDLNPEQMGIEALEEAAFEYGDGNKSPAQAVSLRKYCPPPRSQAGLPGGVRLGLAVGYGCMTILKASQQKWTPAQVRQEAFSAYFPFEMLPKDPANCRVGKGYFQALQRVLTEAGNLKAAAYDQTGPSCRHQPGNAQKQQALRYRIDNMLAVFRKTAPEPDKIANTRRWLRAGQPVVAMLLIDPGFDTFQGDTWKPNDLLLTNHPIWQPLVVIGYDDNRRAFELLNSMGSGWGRGGFAWISYDDFARRADIAIRLIDHPDEPLPVRPAPARPIPTTPVARRRPPAPMLRGGGNLEQLLAVTTETYQTQPVALTYRTHYYETNATFAVGQQVRFVSGQLPQYGYVYIFSVDAARKAELHFPEPGQSSYVADDDARLVFPRPLATFGPNGNLQLQDQGFSKDIAGTDWLVVLYSRESLPRTQLERWLRQLSVSSESVVPSLPRVLGEQMVPWRLIRFEPQAMRFSVGDGPGAIVPLVIKINGD